jgi:hypothetical protein
MSLRRAAAAVALFAAASAAHAQFVINEGLRQRRASLPPSATPSLRVETPVPGVPGFYDYNTASFRAAADEPGAFRHPGGRSRRCRQWCRLRRVRAGGGRRGPRQDRDDRSRRLRLRRQAKNAQNAGAFGVIIVNNVAGSAPGLGGSDPTIVIPTVSVSQAQGAILKQAVADAVKYGTRSRAGAVVANFAFDATRKAGADALGRPLLYTPNPLIGGSSVSHWDVSAFPNLLMEPNINSDLNHLAGAAAGPDPAAAERPRLVKRAAGTPRRG